MKIVDVNNDVHYFSPPLSELAHCKTCCEPMFMIYDQSLRDDCWDCEGKAKHDSLGDLADLRRKRMKAK